MTAKDEIRAKAAALGWTHTEGQFGLSDTFVIDTKADSALAKLIALGHIDWQPTNTVFVRYYTEKYAVEYATLSTPGQQSVLTGKVVGVAQHTKGPARKGQVLSWLEWGAS